MITKYGLDVLIFISLFSLILIFVSLFFIKPQLIKYIIIFVASTVIIFTLYFFRDPERFPPDNPLFILAPADGKIISINEVFEKEFLNSDAYMISIFMSPLNVHVNRYPVGGTIKYFKHIEGKHLVAFADKSSDLNERTLIGIENENIKILFKQIAGILARRIVADVELGKNIKAGEKFGMIKFGSRVDIFFPKNSVEVLIKLNDKTVAGETILAKILEEAII